MVCDGALSFLDGSQPSIIIIIIIIIITIANVQQRRSNYIERKSQRQVPVICTVYGAIVGAVGMSSTS